MIRIVVEPEAPSTTLGAGEVRVDPPTSNGRHVRFHAILDGEHIALSHQPLADAARVLLERGYDPATPLTMRHRGKSYDSFQPMPLGDWAKLTYAEGVNRVLRKEIWKPHPNAVSRGAHDAKVDLEAPEGGNTHPGAAALE